MAKKVKNDTDFLSEILSKTGGKTLDEVGRVPWYHDLGNLALNYINSGRFIGGGLPGGKIIEVFGGEASAKSLLGYCFLGGVQKADGIAVHLDCERSSNADFAEAAGHVDAKRLVTFEPIHYKEVERKILDVVKAIRQHYGKDKPIGIILDSIGVIPTEREWRVVDIPLNATEKDLEKIGAERPGERARAAGDLLRVITPFLDENNATLYIINQIRSKIGVMWGSPETTAGGGKALPFYASDRLRMTAQKEIQHKDRKVPVGVRLKVKNKKNRSFTPGLETYGIKLYFAQGIDPLSGLLSILIAAGRVKGTGGNYQITEPWANGKIVKFKASTADERNEVPLEPLLACPAVVDAQSEEEVKAYIGNWAAAMELSTSGETVDKDVEDTLDKLNIEDYDTTEE